jgi:transcriptional antiterminator RfaH
MQSTESQEKAAWFCLRSRRKHEYIAAAQLAELQGVKVFAPRIRFRRPTHTGLQWTTEALFPSYFFARIGPSMLRRSHYATHVRGIVHFGNSWPTIPDQTIEELEKRLGGGQVHVIVASVSAGDEVEIIEGIFRGFEAVVTQVMPARKRVAILLDLLGRQTVVEMKSDAIFKNVEQRESVFRAAQCCPTLLLPPDEWRCWA